MIDRFQQYIEQNKLCDKNDQILVAVSGGVDSIVLLDLFKQTEYNIAIAHCNFQLRGVDSDADDQFVKNLGVEYKVKVYSKRFETKTYADYHKVSIQVAARDLRYAWFEELLKEKGIDFVAVAHHADDQVETFFINLSRGSGLSGLKGIPIKRNKIIRPLLFANRFEILAYSKENKLAFREDLSNLEDKYLRNKIRLKLLPELIKYVPKTKETIIESMEHLLDADIVFQQMLNEKYNTISKQKGGQVIISIHELTKLNPLDTWLYYLLRKFGFNRSTTNKVAETILKGQVGKVFMSASQRMLIDRNELVIRNIDISFKEVHSIDQGQNKITQPIDLTFRIVPKDKSFKINRSTNIAQLDFDKINFPLQIRSWKKGDRFKPLGMKGSKLLSDFFIDIKINLFEKEDMWLLFSGSEIVWVIGYRISDKFKITSKTDRVFLIENVI